jgi:hypothetical protein
MPLSRTLLVTHTIFDGQHLVTQCAADVKQNVLPKIHRPILNGMPGEIGFQSQNEVDILVLSIRFLP